MQLIASVLAPVFWGLLLLSALVFIHEGGHFIAARACGVRVSEFFLGLPCRIRLAHRSKRCGTLFGVTPLLLGGYAAICGMEHDDSPCAPHVLAEINRRGHATVQELADTLALDSEVILNTCIMLMNWGSIAPVYDSDDRRSRAYYPETYATVRRDRRGNTVLDGKLFDSADAMKEGDPWSGDIDDSQLFAQEKSRTYDGVSFPRRALILLAGILVNIIAGMLLLMSVYSIIGFSVPQDVNRIGEVIEGSPAYAAGITAGDCIVQIDGTEVETWTELVTCLQECQQKDPNASLSIVYEHDGKQHTTDLTLDDGKLGIYATTEHIRFNILDSARLSVAYVIQTAKGVVQLLIPTQTMQVLDQSTSIVGISIMSAQAAAAGPATFLTFAGLISLSLGLMNLLPIPPLDGGKLIIEIVQRVRKKDVSLRVQTIISYVGIVLFALLFVYMLRADILRFF